MVNHKKEGKIKVIIHEPKLLDGSYSVSIWFGNSKEEYIIESDCLTLEVAGMTKFIQLIASQVGSVIPKCEWEFK